MSKRCLFLPLLLSSVLSFAVNANDTIATVNGEPLVLKELSFIEWKNRLTAPDSSFQKEKRLEAAIQIKLQQQLAKKLGLVNDISYHAFQTELEVENQRRLSSLKNKEVFYGPIQYTEENYFQYKFSNLVIGIKNQLSENDFKPTDENLKTYYEIVKDSLYKMQDYIKVQRFEIILKNRETDDFQQNKIIRKIQFQISKQNIELETLKKLVKNIGEIKSQIQIFDPIYSQNMEGEERAEVMNLIGNIKIGQFCPIPKQSGSIYFYRLLQRKPMGYRNFESVKNSLKSRYIDSSYIKYILEIREKAIIVRY